MNSDHYSVLDEYFGSPYGTLHPQVYVYTGYALQKGAATCYMVLQGSPPGCCYGSGARAK